MTPMSELKEGDPAPALDLPVDGGGRVTSAVLAGKPYVVYFYPKDDTPITSTPAALNWS